MQAHDSHDGPKVVVRRKIEATRAGLGRDFHGSFNAAKSNVRVYNVKSAHLEEWCKGARTNKILSAGHTNLGTVGGLSNSA